MAPNELIGKWSALGITLETRAFLTVHAGSVELLAGHWASSNCNVQTNEKCPVKAGHFRGFGEQLRVVRRP